MDASESQVGLPEWALMPALVSSKAPTSKNHKVPMHRKGWSKSWSRDHSLPCAEGCLCLASSMTQAFGEDSDVFDDLWERAAVTVARDSLFWQRTRDVFCKKRMSCSLLKVWPVMQLSRKLTGNTVDHTPTPSQAGNRPYGTARQGAIMILMMKQTTASSGTWKPAR